MCLLPPHGRGRDGHLGVGGAQASLLVTVNRLAGSGRFVCTCLQCTMHDILHDGPPESTCM